MECHSPRCRCGRRFVGLQQGEGQTKRGWQSTAWMQGARDGWDTRWFGDTDLHSAAWLPRPWSLRAHDDTRTRDAGSPKMKMGSVRDFCELASTGGVHSRSPSVCHIRHTYGPHARMGLTPECLPLSVWLLDVARLGSICTHACVLLFFCKYVYIH
jgi:hypothetical protein